MPLWAIDPRLRRCSCPPSPHGRLRSPDQLRRPCYSVVIGPNLNRLKGSEKKTFVLVSRINRMTPSNSTNLDNFVTAYRSFGRYLLAPAQIGPEPTFFPQLFIAKRNLHIRQAWQIGENDPDVLALQENDNPVIPAVVADPPVTKALTWIRALKRATPHER
jgi:hypothetical protein